MKWLFSRRGTMMLSALLGLFSLLGCAHVSANYPERSGHKKWTSKLDGPRCEYQGLIIRVNDKTTTLDSRSVLDSLEEPMRKGMGKAAFNAMSKQSYKGYELFEAMLKDRNFVFYRGSLILNERKEIVFHRGCLLLTIRTKEGTVTARDDGIIFPKNRDENIYQDSKNGPIPFGLSYNQVMPGDENNLRIRSRVFGVVQSVEIDSTRIQFGQPQTR